IQPCAEEVGRGRRGGAPVFASRCALALGLVSESESETATLPDCSRWFFASLENQVLAARSSCEPETHRWSAAHTLLRPEQSAGSEPDLLPLHGQLRRSPHRQWRWYRRHGWPSVRAKSSAGMRLPVLRSNPKR